MKAIFTFILLALSIAAQAGDTYRNPWPGHEQQVSRNEKIAMCKRVVLPKGFKYADYYEHFHVIDFNADGRTDLVYDGTAPYSHWKHNACFFLNDKDSFRLVVRLNGNPFYIFSKTGEPMDFSVMNDGIVRYSFSQEQQNCFKPGKKDSIDYGDVNNSRCCLKVMAVCDFEYNDTLGYIYAGGDSLAMAQQFTISDETDKPDTVKHNPADLEDHDDMMMNPLALFQVPIYIAAAIILCVVAWVEIKKHKKNIK